MSRVPSGACVSRFASNHDSGVVTQTFFNRPQFTVNKNPLQAKLGLADFDLEDEKVG